MNATKQMLREKVRAVLKGVDTASRTEAGAALVQAVSNHPLWQNAGAVMLFAPLPDEPPVGELLPLCLAAGKTLCLPRHRAGTDSYEAAVVKRLERDLVTARFGILEPSPDCPALPLKQLDLVFVPGVAFASDGARLGRGRGFYDRILSEVTGERVGLAFTQQVVDGIPMEAHDAPLTALVTPKSGWMRIASRTQ